MSRPAFHDPASIAANGQGRLSVFAAVIALAVCSFGQVESQPSSSSSIAPPPESFGPFLQWATRELQSWPAPAELPPEPSFPAPRWKVIRLADKAVFSRAVVQSDFRPARTDSAPVLKLGPYRSDQPGDNMVAERVPRRSPREEDQTAIHLRGFEIERERVGAMEMELRIPHGRDFVLKWEQGGSMPIPVQSNSEPFKVRISTADLPLWKGPLTKLEFRTKGIGRGVVEIRSITMLARSESLPLAAAVERIRLKDEARDAFYVRGSAQIAFPEIQIPANGRLTLGLARVGGEAARPTSRVRLTARSGESARVVLEHAVEKPEQWFDQAVSLAEWAGKRVDLVFEVSADDPSVATIVGGPTVYEPVENPPINVIYLIDTLGAGHTNVYGYPRETTPFLAELARDGTWFPEMFANSSRTIESIPDIMLSIPVERHGVYTTSATAPPSLATLAETLQAAGFATVSFCTNVNAGPNTGMDQGFDVFFDRIGHFWSEADRTVPLEEARAWLAARLDRPCFIYVHTAEPHAPYLPPDGFKGRFTAGYDGPVDGSMTGEKRFRLARSPRDIAHVVGLHDEEILYADSRLRLFVDLMKDLKAWPRTTLMVTADHGEAFAQHGFWEHGLDLHNETTRIPLVVVGPDVKKGQASRRPAQLFDLMPTILEQHGLTAGHVLEGMSLLPQLRGEGDSAQVNGRVRRIFASNHNFRPVSGRLEFSVTVPGEWKVFFKNRQERGPQQRSRSRFRLFDLRADPTEQSNVLLANQEVARKLILELVEWRKRQHPYGAVDGVRRNEIGHRQMQDLEALGYVGGAEDPGADDEDDDR